MIGERRFPGDNRDGRIMAKSPQLRGTGRGSLTAADFAEALADSRATVSEQMEEEYAKMKGELKRKALEVKPIGFIWDGMVESTRDSKH